MPRTLHIIPPSKVNITLPLDIRVKLAAYLYSELEQRIPYGKYSEFFLARVREFFGSTTLDLAPFAATEPGVYTVSGTKETIAVLERTLKGEFKL